MNKYLIYTIGILSILISLAAWSMDVSHLVEPCIYCRIERTIIGMIGVIVLLPIIPFLTRFILYVLGFFGAHVASQQMLLVLMQYKIDLELVLATAALFIIIAQVLFFSYVIFYHYQKSDIYL